MAENRSRVWIWVLLGGGAFFLFLVAVFTVVYIGVSGGSNSHSSDDGFAFGDKIGVIDVEGVIIDPEQTVKDLKHYADDDSIKAIILHIDSPGGGAAASQEIYDEVLTIRDKKKKRIVASISTVGASGAYYIASATNKIYADRASIVGSIGVIAEWVNYEDLLKWAKLKDVTLKAGEFKDTGSPTREMTPAERAYMQGLIDDMHDQFIADVAAGRKMKDEDIRPIANGKVWTGAQALPLHLIDATGNFQDAVEDTAKSVGIKGEPTLVKPEHRRRTLMDVLFGDISEYLPDRAKMLQQNPGFYFLWR